MSFRVRRDDLGLYAVAVGWSGLTTPIMRGLIGVSMPHLSGAAPDQVLFRTRQLITSGLVRGLPCHHRQIAEASVETVWNPSTDRHTVRRSRRPWCSFLQRCSSSTTLCSATFSAASIDPAWSPCSKPACLSHPPLALLISLQFDPVLGPAIVSLATYLAACVLYAVAIARELGIRPIRLVDVSMIRVAAGAPLIRASRHGWPLRCVAVNRSRSGEPGRRTIGALAVGPPSRPRLRAHFRYVGGPARCSSGCSRS